MTVTTKITCGANIYFMGKIHLLKGDYVDAKYQSKYLPPANEVCEGYVFTGVCLSTGFSVWGVSIQGGLHPGGLHPGGSLSMGVSVHGVSVQGVSEGVSVQGVSVQKGSLFRRVSVQGVSVRETLADRDPPHMVTSG